MISELPDPQNAGGQVIKLYRPANSYISSARGCFTPSELNIRDMAEQGVAEIGCEKRNLRYDSNRLAPIPTEIEALDSEGTKR